jgi:hypothetical protein
MPVNVLTINADGLANLALDNQQIPSEGSKALSILLDFTQANQFTVDLANLQARGFMSMIQTVYVDMSTTDVPMNMIINGSRQALTFKGRTQGFYTVMCPNPVKLTFICPGGPGQDVTTGRYGVTIHFLNVPIPGAVWPTV